MSFDPRGMGTSVPANNCLGDAEVDAVSYGTHLGATYADMFPEHTEFTVLDGAMDPALDYDWLRRDQAIATVAALSRFVSDCLASVDCPLSGDIDAGMDQLAGIVAALDIELYVAADRRTLSGRERWP